MNIIENPLEDVKVKSALRSQEMSLSYRQEYNPEEINILDYTVIASLKKQVPTKMIAEISRTKINGVQGYDYRCICGKHVSELDNYCRTCGQKFKINKNC